MFCRRIGHIDASNTDHESSSRKRKKSSSPNSRGLSEKDTELTVDCEKKELNKECDGEQQQQEEHGATSFEDLVGMIVSDTEDSSDMPLPEVDEQVKDNGDNCKGRQQAEEEDCDDKRRQEGGGKEDGDDKGGQQGGGGGEGGENGDEKGKEGGVVKERKRYELRKRTTTTTTTTDAEKVVTFEEEEKGTTTGCNQQPTRMRVLKRAKGRTKPSNNNKRGTGSRSQANKRRSQTIQEDSSDDDDYLLLDGELDESQCFPWRGRFGSPPSMGVDDLDYLHRTTAWNLNVAASGWAHHHQQQHGGGSLSAHKSATTTVSTGDGGADHIQPLKIDENVSFDDVGGLSNYIDQLKEMVFLPLLYPVFFASYNIVPPRGVLLCGPPGTGKTLIARALACAASKVAGQKVSFYMRKGADVLSKWVGEAERQLKLLFDEAQRNQPSIIFFDEIDGLAPARSSKQDQIHNSVVSTLLALMDGIDSRGQVILIGATNRVDSIDGALRRPGRFDRELNFPLPDREARAEILGIHTRKWKFPPSEGLKMELAASCIGYCGADLKSLCTESAILALRQKYPQVYTSDEKLLIDVDSVKVKKCHFIEAMSTITPASQRGSLVQSRPLPSVVEPCLKRHLKKAMDKISDIFPFLQFSSKIISFACPFPLVYRPRLLLWGHEGVGLEHLGPAILHELEKFPVHSLELSCLVSDPNAMGPEHSLTLQFAKARRNTPSILYLPRFHLWWETADIQLRALLLNLVEDLPTDSHILLLGTSFVSPDELDGENSSVFPLHSVYQVDKPSSEDRCLFFEKMIETALSTQPDEGNANKSQKPDSLPQLSKVPKVVTGPTKHELQAKLDDEEHNIRQLRMCLRDVCDAILINKSFKTFHYPEIDDDLRSTIENPMDMATLLQRVDSQTYFTLDAFLKDVDLILTTAKAYYGDDYNGRRIVSTAHKLRDNVLAMVAGIDPIVVEICEKIGAEREKEASVDNNCLENQRGGDAAAHVNAEVVVNVDDDHHHQHQRGSSRALESTKNKAHVSGEAEYCRSQKENNNNNVKSVKRRRRRRRKSRRQSPPNAGEVEAMKQLFVEWTNGYDIPQLQRLYTRIMTTLLTEINKNDENFGHQPSSSSINANNIMGFLLQFIHQNFDTSKTITK